MCLNVLKEMPYRAGTSPPLSGFHMANSKARTSSSANEQTPPAIQSALNTLEAEAGGITALATALKSDLGPAFVAAVERIRAAKGRLIVTGLGKSGHIGRKIAATFASTGTPSFFVHGFRGQPRRSRHDHRRRRHHGAVVVRRDRRAEEPHQLFPALPHRIDRGNGRR